MKNMEKMLSVKIHIILAILLPQIASLAYCPNKCVCDNEKLHVTCGEGELDVLPIALNPSINRLVIKFNKIKSVDESIQFYMELTMLDLSYNHLLNVPEKMFMYQKKLLQLHLNNNKIGGITNKTFQGLDELRVLNLRGNMIDEISAGMFKALPKLEELNLGQNRIKNLNPLAFEGLTSLRILYLDDNSINMIPTVSLTPLKMLAELYLGTNNLYKIQMGAFESLSQLRKLDVRGSMLINITVDTFKGLENIRSLDISDNHLLKVPTVQLSNLKRLEELTIGQNDFEIIPEGAFFGLSNLKKIDISGALNLKTIQAGAFSANTNLETIVIASNKVLEDIQEGAFSGLPHIQNVILRDNGMKTFREELLPWKNLKNFDVSENPIHCNCHILWLKKLLQRRGVESELDQVVCITPERLHGEPLQELSGELLGCQHVQAKERAIFGAIIVASAASVTTFVLILYRLRHKIFDRFRTNWNNKRNTLQEEKDLEFQKSYNEVEYHQPHCNIYTYNNYHPAYRNYLQQYSGQYAQPQQPNSNNNHYNQFAHHIYEVPKNLTDS